MALATVQVTGQFYASHWLPGHPRCGELHSHIWSYHVTITGEVNPETGMVADFHDIKDRVEEFNGKTLNNFESIGIPTSENICIYLATNLAWSNPTFTEVEVQISEKEGYVSAYTWPNKEE